MDRQKMNFLCVQLIEQHSMRTQQKLNIQNVPGGKVNILEGHSVRHSKQKSVYVHVSYSERFPR
jgi:hypothetical protein